MIDLLIQVLIFILTASSVGLLIWSVFGYPVPIEPPLHRRIAMALGADKRQTIFEQPALQPVLSLLLQLAKHMSFTALRNRIRTDLNANGNPNGYSVDEYIALCLASSLGFLLCASLLAMAFMGLPDPLLAVAAFGVGFMVPLWVLRGEARKRVQRISKQLPYSLDLIALMMGAGATFGEAIDTIIRDNPEDDLNQELAVVQSEINFGTNRAQALRNMADRIPLETLRSVVGAINQSEALGTPVSEILKNQSSIMRMHRSVRAEKLSASASLRILIPSMLILIAVVLVVFAPLIIRYRNQGSFF